MCVSLLSNLHKIQCACAILVLLKLVNTSMLCKSCWYKRNRIDGHALLYLLVGNWWVLDSLLSLLWKLDESGTSLPGTSVMLGKGFWLRLTQSEQSQWYPKSIVDNDCTLTRYMRCSIVLCNKEEGRANSSIQLETDSASEEARIYGCIYRMSEKLCTFNCRIFEIWL